MAKKEKTKPEKAEALKPEKAKKATKASKADKGDKKKKGKKGEAAPGAAAGGTPDLSTMSPDQMTAAQLEQAIKESSDPSARLKRLRSPLNVRSCLLNVLFLIVLTFGVVVLWCYLVVDKFNFPLIMTDMFEKFGIIKFFTNLGTTIAGWFGGGGGGGGGEAGGEAAEALIAIIRSMF